MVDAKFNFRVKVNPKILGTQLANSFIQKAYEDALLDVAGELQSNTPVGATGRLKAGWDIELGQVLIGSSIQFIAKIVNRAPYAKYGIIGRPPGKMPPLQPIVNWVVAKGSVNPTRDAWKVRIAIAQKGTLRWRNNDNWVGLDKQGKIKPDSPLQKLKEYFQQKIK